MPIIVGILTFMNRKKNSCSAELSMIFFIISGLGYLGTIIGCHCTFNVSFYDNIMGNSPTEYKTLDLH